MEDQFLLGQRTRMVPFLLLGCLRTRAFHQENTHRQAHLRVPDGHHPDLSSAKLLAMDTRESATDEPEQCTYGRILL